MGIRITKEPWWIRHRTIGFAVGIVLICVGVPIYLFLVLVESIWSFLTGAEPETYYEDLDYENCS